MNYMWYKLYLNNAATKKKKREKIPALICCSFVFRERAVMSEAFLSICVTVLSCAVLSRSVVWTLCDPMDCSPPGSSVHGDSPVKNTRVGCHALLQGIFPNQGSNPSLPRCRPILYHLRQQGLQSYIQSLMPVLSWTKEDLLQVLSPLPLLDCSSYHSGLCQATGGVSGPDSLLGRP